MALVWLPGAAALGCVLAGLAARGVAAASAGGLTAFVVATAAGDRACEFSAGQLENGTAYAVFDDLVDSTGWGQLEVWTPPAASERWSPPDQAFAAGCLEGFLTQLRMHQYWSNYAAAEYGPAGPGPKLLAFMAAQLEYARGVAAAEAGSAFWRGLGLLLAQFDGLAAGYGTAAPPEQALSPLLLYMLNSVGDLEDLNGLFGGGRPTAAGGLGGRMPVALKETDCSAMIVATPGELLAGQTTWRGYYAMLRVYKVYHFSFTPAGVVSFSSSPGLIHSKDDFYTAGSGLVVMETTNSVFNESLFAAVTPQCALSWQRAMVATQFADSGASWTALFSVNNSGSEFVRACVRGVVSLLCC